MFRYLLPGDSEFTNSVVVYRNVNFQSVVGDYNGNGTVRRGRLHASGETTRNASVPMGTGADGNGNGVIDAADYQIWKTNFGMTSSPRAAAVVNEFGPGAK